MALGFPCSLSLSLSLSRLSTNWPRFALGTHHLRVCNQAKVFRLSFSLCFLSTSLFIPLPLLLALFAFVSIEHCKHTHTHTNTHCTYLEFKVKVFQFQVLWRQVRASTTPSPFRAPCFNCDQLRQSLRAADRTWHPPLSLSLASFVSCAAAWICFILFPVILFYISRPLRAHNSWCNFTGWGRALICLKFRSQLRFRFPTPIPTNQGHVLIAEMEHTRKTTEI